MKIVAKMSTAIAIAAVLASGTTTALAEIISPVSVTVSPSNLQIPIGGPFTSGRTFFVSVGFDAVVGVIDLSFDVVEMDPVSDDILFSVTNEVLQAGSEGAPFAPRYTGNHDVSAEQLNSTFDPQDPIFSEGFVLEFAVANLSATLTSESPEPDIPEPGTLSLLVAALLGAMLWRRDKSSAGSKLTRTRVVADQSSTDRLDRLLPASYASGA